MAIVVKKYESLQYDGMNAAAIEAFAYDVESFQTLADNVITFYSQSGGADFFLSPGDWVVGFYHAPGEMGLLWVGTDAAYQGLFATL